MTEAAEQGNYTGDIQAVRRVADIIGLFTLRTPRLTVAEAAQRVGLNRTTVHRYFRSMVAMDLLQRDRDEPSAFVPGPLLLQLGAVAHGTRRVLDVAPAHMHELSREVGLTCVLSLWGSSGPVVSMVSEPPQSAILVTVRVGTQLGIESAQTRVFLAFAPDHDYAARALKGLSTRDSALVRRDIDGAAETGGCQVESAGVDGIVAAQAVFDQNGIVAALAIIGTLSTLGNGSGRGRVERLRSTALEITEALAGTDTLQSALGGSLPERSGKRRPHRTN